ncbi:hypothetical protein ASPFODRAFT_49668 [Aspergillus luchuensis CBS 106.47]|uniref:Uncharacterized protein n=1 Tax=Aspergillus luchuensis (strain CBS 106.47) TaxID=1137211 RepID=A0A1M3TBN4_ASPLC|nr:hypothetical protein ASPFODRAFT_49668 [Aspergillus luchuensis CBS 106.47]
MYKSSSLIDTLLAATICHATSWPDTPQTDGYNGSRNQTETATKRDMGKNYQYCKVYMLPSLI